MFGVNFDIVWVVMLCVLLLEGFGLLMKMVFW